MEDGYETWEWSHGVSQTVDDLDGLEWGGQEGVYFGLIIHQVNLIYSIHNLFFILFFH